mgnify:CR=1 FL=1
MKYKKILTWACTAALFLTGCTTDTINNGRWMEDSNAVRIQASAGSTLTRSNPIDESKQTGFNQGDKISVRNRNITVNYTLNGEIWQPVDNDKYLVWDEKDLTFEAYYPYDGKNDFSVGYIKKDQSTPEDLAQSDYMNITSKLQSIPSDKHLTLKLERKTARLIFNIQKFNDEFSTEAKVTELKIYSYENTNEETTDDWGPITPYQVGNGGVGTTYTALVIPGVIYAELNTSETHSYLPDEEPEALELKTGELKAGYSYTYNLIVGKNKVTVGGVTVAEWDTGYTLPGGVAEEEDLTPYVTMTATSNQTFKMTCAGTYTLPNLEYSVNNGTWLKVVADKGVEFGDNLGSLRLRGKCPNGTAKNYYDYSTITFKDPSVKVECSGDIRTLIDYTAHETVATATSCFCSLFNGCSVLTSAPKLPAKALKMWCYNSMFKGCTSLTKAPDLPATELPQLCYESMFEGCTSLTKAPDLPATKLEIGCYESMFKDCTALTDAPMLSAKDLKSRCYRHMFDGCKSLVKAPDLPATTLGSSCYDHMFANCTALTDAPELKATIIIDNAYLSMFEGCTSLVNAPVLPGTELHNSCYESMFSGCTALTTAPVLDASTLFEHCYRKMFYNCSNLKSVTILGTFRNLNNLDDWLKDAGTSAVNRTLKVSSKAFYDEKMALKNPTKWQIPNCKVLDEEDKEITE